MIFILFLLQGPINHQYWQWKGISLTLYFWKKNMYVVKGPFGLCTLYVWTATFATFILIHAKFTLKPIIFVLVLEDVKKLKKWQLQLTSKTFILNLLGIFKISHFHLIRTFLWQLYCIDLCRLLLDFHYASDVMIFAKNVNKHNHKQNWKWIVNSIIMLIYAVSLR